jgi:Stage II sporulation protein E (SpoIIE)/PAS fold
MSDRRDVGRDVDFAAVFGSVLSPLGLFTSDFTFVAVNDAYCRTVGRLREHMIGNKLFDVFPDHPDGTPIDPTSPFRRSLSQVVESGEPVVLPIQRYDVAHPETGTLEDRYWSITIVPVLDATGAVEHVLVHPEEITSFIQQRLGTANAGSRSTSSTHALDTAFTAAMAHLTRLSDLWAALAGAGSVDDVADAMLHDGLAVVSADAGSIITLSNDQFNILAATGISEETVDEWERFGVEPGRDPFSDVITVGEPLFFDDRDTFFAAYPHLIESIRDDHHQAWAVLPLRDGHNIIGAYGLIYTNPNPFDDALRLVLYTVTTFASQAVARAQSAKEHVSTLRSIDAALLEPIVDVVDGISSHGLYRQSMHSVTAGGDWYDLIEIAPGIVLIVVGDVANHGAEAVGEMARVRTIIQTLAIDGHLPAAIATKASEVLNKLSTTITTAFVGILDVETRVLTWTTAGHPFPLILSDDGTQRLLEVTHGPPLGAICDVAYQSGEVVLSQGDALFVYTDGLIERRSEAYEQGLARLASAVTALFEEGQPQSHPATKLYEALHPTGRHGDDVAILCVRV